MKKIIIGLMCALSFGALAEIYKWTDENGKVHFGDKPKATNQAEKIEVRKQKTGTLATPTQRYQVAKARQSEKTDLERAEEKYKKVREGFYETRNPDPLCKEMVDLRDQYNASFQLKGKKREVYLCPKEKQ